MTGPRTTDTPIRPVILAGGSGTRLWPASRASFPKQFTTLISEESLFQSAVLRLTGKGYAAPLVITTEPFRFVALEQMENIGITPAEVLIEPSARNTGPAVAAALVWMGRHDPDATLLVAPSDHAIADTIGFRGAVRTAADAATEAGEIVTFGIPPTRAETGYGWLKLAPEADVAAETPQPLEEFVEKPDIARAGAMLKGGRHLWNAGLFLGPAPAFRAAFEAHAPAILKVAEAALAAARSELGFTRLDPAIWAGLETISLDRAVMEKTGNLSVMPWAGGWSDLGSWDAVWRDGGGGTVTSGNVTAIDCDGSYLASEPGQRLVGIGLENMVAVATGDAVLVAPRDAAQAVGQAVARLKAEGVPQATEFPRDHRPWGWFETLALGERFRVKRIVVTPGGRLSLQSHQRRAEHWVVVAGTAQVTLGGTARRLSENQSLYVPVGEKHRLENITDTPLVLIEVQTGAYLGEDDIERFDDVYARE